MLSNCIPVIVYLYVTIFIWEIRFTGFPKWLRILINTNFLKVLRFGIFIQVCQKVSLTLKLENVTRFSGRICLISETRSDHYLLPKVLIKWSFWFPRKTFVYLKLKTEIAVYRFLWFKLFKFCFQNSIIIWSLKPVSKEFVSKNKNFDFVISKSMHKPSSPLEPEHVFCFIIF